MTGLTKIKKIKQKEKEINTLINKFLKKYTTAKIMEMKIDYYVEGKADENGNENPKYFKQNSELDAYAFLYALMKYKHKNVDLYVPKYYGNEFYSIIKNWLEHFKNMMKNRK